MAPDMDVIINLRDCCDALGLDVTQIQRDLTGRGPSAYRIGAVGEWGFRSQL
jgi:hypothetical protein